MAAGAALDVLGLLVGGAARVLGEAAGAATVEADALALAGDAVALAGARGAVRGGSAVARRAGAVGAVGQGRADRGDRGARGAKVGDDVLVVVVVVVDAGSGKPAAELLLVKVTAENVAGGVGRDGLGGLDLGDGQGAALGDIAAGAGAGALGGRGRFAGRGLGRGRRGRLGLGDIKDVQGTAGGGLNGRVLAGVVRDVVAIDDVVVPVAGAGLEGGRLEAEGALPGAGLGRGLVLGERELAAVVVPGAEEVDGLDARGDAEGERKLDGGHFGFVIKKLNAEILKMTS